MNTEQESNKCPHGFPQEIRKECEACKKLLEVYQDENYETLYRYENITTPNNQEREGVVSKQELIGNWFTNNQDDLATYIKARQPGGNVVLVRISKAELDKFDASQLTETMEMDIEAGNYIIPSELQNETRLTIPLVVEVASSNKFMMKDWRKVNDFVKNNLSKEQLLDRIKTGSF
jgi:hypothetical protein